MFRDKLRHTKSFKSLFEQKKIDSNQAAPDRKWFLAPHQQELRARFHGGEQKQSKETI